MDDASFRAFQVELIKNPTAGDVIRRGKGKRGGLRAIYYWWVDGHQFWLFTLYNKDEMNDLSTKERQALAEMLRRETQVRTR